MSRFKLWLSFWRKDHGFGLIEAALVLPLFLLVTFAVIEFGNMYLQRYQARDISSHVADYLQDNPDASYTDLFNFIQALGVGTLKNTDGRKVNNIYQKIKIQSAKTMMTPAEFDSLCSASVKTWANPWLGGDARDDNNPYYIHICYPYAYETITPLSGLTGGALPRTRILNGKAIAYVNAQITCPAGQFISNSGGKAVCTQVNAICPDGRYLTAVVGSTPICRQMEVKLGIRFNPYTLDQSKGTWVDPGTCRQTWTTPGGSSTTCEPDTVKQTCRWMGPNVGYGCTSTTIPGKCTTTQNPDSIHDNGKKEWSQYTKNGKVFCTDDNVSDVTKLSNDCPAGTVQTGVSASTVWCKAISIE